MCFHWGVPPTLHPDSISEWRGWDCLWGCRRCLLGPCYFGWRAIQRKITMCLWLICIAVQLGAVLWDRLAISCRQGNKSRIKIKACSCYSHNRRKKKNRWLFIQVNIFYYLTSFIKIVTVLCVFLHQHAAWAESSWPALFVCFASFQFTCPNWLTTCSLCDIWRLTKQCREPLLFAFILFPSLQVTDHNSKQH